MNGWSADNTVRRPGSNRVAFAEWLRKGSVWCALSAVVPFLHGLILPGMSVPELARLRGRQKRQTKQPPAGAAYWALEVCRKGDGSA